MKFLADLFQDSANAWDLGRVAWGWSLVAYTGTVLVCAIHDPKSAMDHIAEIAGGFAAILAAGGGGAWMHSKAT